MSYELQLPDVTIIPTPVGVVNVIPSQVQPVAIIGTVNVTQPIDVVLPSSSVTIGTVNQGLAGTQPWPVTLSGSTPGTNLFATTDTVPFGIETTILTYTVTASFGISQLVAWGTYDGEFLIRQNGSVVGGGRTSAAVRTLSLNYSTAKIPTMIGDIVTVTILEYGPGLQQFRCNLLGE